MQSCLKCCPIFCCCLKQDEETPLLNQSKNQTNQEANQTNQSKQTLEGFQKCNLKVNDRTQQQCFMYNDEEYILGQQLGVGAYSKVFKVYLTNQDKYQVLKVLTGNDQVEEYISEYNILNKIDHPFIVKFYGCVIVENSFCFLMEYAELQTLQEFLDNPYKYQFQSHTLIDMAENIFMGIQHLQTNKILHRDLKPDNILLFSNFQAKIADLGLSKFIITNQLVTKKGNILYAATEKKELDGNFHFGLPSDIYSAGLIVCQLLLKLSLKQVAKISIQQDMQVLSNIPEELKKFIEKIIQNNPDNRPKCEEIIEDIKSFKINKDILKFISKQYELEEKNECQQITNNENDQKTNDFGEQRINSHEDHQEQLQEYHSNSIKQPLLIQKNINIEQRFPKIEGNDLNAEQTKKVQLIIVGDCNVGKSSIMNTFFSEKYTESKATTLGVNHIKKQQLINNDQIDLIMFDTSGQEKYQSVVQMYYRQMNKMSVFIIVYSIENARSFYNIGYFVSQIQKAHTGAQIVIIGNKCDLIDQRQITTQQGFQMAEIYSLPFFETSAKDYESISSIFNTILSQIIIQSQHNNLKSKHNQKSSKIIQISEIKKVNKKQNCC